MLSSSRVLAKRPSEFWLSAFINYKKKETNEKAFQTSSYVVGEQRPFKEGTALDVAADSLQSVLLELLLDFWGEIQDASF